MTSTRIVFPQVVRHFARDIGAGLVRLAYPPTCAWTGESIPEGRLGKAARTSLASDANEPACWRCGSAVGPHVPTRPGGCDLCRSERFAFERVLRLGRYRGNLASACLMLKRMSGHHLAVALADLFFEFKSPELRDVGATLVVPVPLHWLAGWRRGYNQAASIADRLASRLGLPCRHHAIRRHRSTKRQHRLSPTDRRQNVKNAFRPGRDRRVRGARVLLVDDVLTTGATCHHAARALMDAGAQSVVVAVIARAGQPKQ